jgi:bifunctional lysine-specific demethylase and histidyl-hydroxylase NO66
VTDPRLSLARCVGEVDRFFSDAWDRRVHLHRGEGFGDLLTLEDVDRIVATTGLRAPAFRLVKDGATLPQSSYTRAARVGSRDISDLIDVARVHAEFDDGATIVLQGLHRYWEPVTRLARDLELVLTHPVQANAYLTPPVAQGLRVHDDPHDVFALQTHGRKHWVTYDDDGNPTLDVELDPGDALYVPRGTPHAARTVDEASIHLTIGVKVLTWADVARSALKDLDSAALEQALPAGFANDPDGFGQLVASRLKEVAHELGGIDGAAVAAAVTRSFWRNRPPLLDGQLAQLLALDAITDATGVALRPAAVCRLDTRDDRARLQLGDRQLLLPGAAEPALRCILERGRLRVRDLEPFLDEQGRLVLVRRLVREGLLVADLG